MKGKYRFFVLDDQPKYSDRMTWILVNFFCFTSVMNFKILLVSIIFWETNQATSSRCFLDSANGPLQTLPFYDTFYDRKKKSIIFRNKKSSNIISHLIYIMQTTGSRHYSSNWFPACNKVAEFSKLNSPENSAKTISSFTGRKANRLSEDEGSIPALISWSFLFSLSR